MKNEMARKFWSVFVVVFASTMVLPVLGVRWQSRLNGPSHKVVIVAAAYQRPYCDAKFTSIVFALQSLVSTLASAIVMRYLYPDAITTGKFSIWRLILFTTLVAVSIRLAIAGWPIAISFGVLMPLLVFASLRQNKEDAAQ